MPKKPKSALQKRKDNPRSGYWKSKADELWGAVIHEKYNFCALGDDPEIQRESPCSGKGEAHHLISRGNVGTRHRLENGILLCTKHHKFCNKISAHMAPVALSHWLQENSPDQYNFVQENKYAILKPDYKQAYEDLQAWCTENAPHLL